MKALLILPILVSALAHAEESCFSVSEVRMVTGKAHGACGILYSTLQFQKTTDMPGGDDFLLRYWTTEAARLGMSLEEYAAQCAQVAENYRGLFESARANDCGG